MITFISGASSNHYKTLNQFLTLFEKYRKNDYKLIVYDLGLNKDELNHIKYNFPKNIYRRFNYENYPDWFNININAGQYAWKPNIIYNICEEFGGIVVWFDAGTYIQRDLTEYINFIKKNSFHTPISGGAIERWTHPTTYKYFNNYNYKKDDNSRAGGCVGMNYDVAWVKNIIKEWKDFSNIKDCIAPEGSSRDNHRQDQTILSILFNHYKRKYDFEDYGERIGWEISQDID